MSPSRPKRKSDGRSNAGKTKAQPARSTSNQQRDSFPIVGIGASAGGLEAFSAFLKALSPHPGLSIVLVPHLDPSRESAFTQILSRTTSIPVLTAQNGIRVQPDHVYVIPPNCDMTIRAGVLVLSDRQEPHTVNTTIDIFLRSLATDQGRNAIGVVLSGTATDGTLGLAAIKGEGGITFAQEPRSAKYDGMPASAISAGYVDFVLTPEAIASELERLKQHPYVAGQLPESAEGQETLDAYMGQIFRLLRRATGVDFSEYKPPTIWRRIQRRMALNRVRKLNEYVSILHRDRGEVNALHQDLLINVTSFFRNSEAFEALKADVYPAVMRARTEPTGPLRIWVPGCSTGEEPYSIAISLMEFLGEEKTEIPVQIFGTDLSEAAIQKARTGVYKESIAADVSSLRLRRFFQKVDTGYQISKTIRDLCIFSTQNVFNDPPFSRMDLISCRNVMIYLSQSLQKKVIPIFHYALNPTGFLIIGSTEGLLGAGSELFDMVDKKQKIYRKKLVSTPVTFGMAVGLPDGGHEAAGGSTSANKQQEPAKPPIELQREADRLLLASYAPPAVVVNEQMEILQTRGRTGSFLELPHGKASLHLLKMAKPGLLFELQKAVEEARKSNSETRRQNVHIDTNGKSSVVTIRVLPFSPSAREASKYLVVFEPQAAETEHVPEAPPAPGGPLTDAERAAKDEQIAQLRQELTATKEYLQSIIEAQEATNEELQSANEEIQSGNEELQSTNEELQTSKEELESANEELHTVNEEMQHRNDLLTQLNNDLNNLLNNVDLPMLMVGSDLTVRRFTPQAGSLLGLMNTDIGRPIPRLKFNLDLPWLEQVMVDILRDAQTKQYQVQDKDNRSYRFRLSPYKTLDNRTDGVVLSVAEVSELQRNGGKAGAKGKKAAPANKKKARRSK